MSSSVKPFIVVGNWKMYKTSEEAVNFVENLIPYAETASSQVYLAVPFTCMDPVAVMCKGTKIIPGAQNMNDRDDGPFTGEISGKMLQSVGAQFVILGHSERRQIFQESNEFINRKIKKAIELNIRPILCIGETASERDKTQTTQVLTSQIKHGLNALKGDQIAELILAYEPIWAIGAKQAASPEVVQKIHFFCRNYIADQYGITVSEKISILYGGSVTQENAKLLMEQNDVDGFLVGSASLNVESFGKIINNSKGSPSKN
jgi:triosephosphate isomerase (TIM)